MASYVTKYEEIFVYATWSSLYIILNTAIPALPMVIAYRGQNHFVILEYICVPQAISNVRSVMPRNLFIGSFDSIFGRLSRL